MERLEGLDRDGICWNEKPISKTRWREGRGVMSKSRFIGTLSSGRRRFDGEKVRFDETGGKGGISKSWGFEQHLLLSGVFDVFPIQS